MGKQKSVSTSGFVQELFRVGLYKKSQGRITRQVTFAAIAVATALAAYNLHVSSLSSTIVGYFYWSDTGNWATAVDYFVPGLLLVFGLWAGYRLVNVSRFADFLIAVEAEMNKVSWPSRAELIRSSVVVIVVMFLLAGVLFAFDAAWQWLFEQLGVLYTGGGK